MTEKSYLWDGTVTGDASEAPYDKDKFNTFMFLLQATDNVLNNAYTVPSYLNDLRTYSDETGMFVIVDSGAAIMGGRYLFKSDTSVSLNIDSIATSGYFRYDYIILRLNTNAQTIRLAVLKGSETNDPTLLSEPTLTQTTLIREIPIARIYVDDATTYIQDKYVHDRRIFATNAYTSNEYKLSDRNLIINSEFMAASGIPSTEPEGWDGAATRMVSKLSKMSRGQAVEIDSTSFSLFLLQSIPINPQYKTFTVKGILKDTTGGSSYSSVTLYPTTLDGTVLPGTFKSQEYINIVANTEIEFQFTVTLDDDTLLKAIQLRVFSSGGTLEVGQIIVVPGYHPGPFREFNETIMFRRALTAAGWSDTAKSSGTTLVDLNADYGLPNRTKGVYVRLRGRDSGSAGGVASIQLQGYAAPYNTIYGTVELDGVNNDVYREGAFYIPVDPPIYNAQDETPQMRIIVVATGAGTFDATAEIIGVDT
jgi:hypothetical protein